MSRPVRTRFVALCCVAALASVATTCVRYTRTDVVEDALLSLDWFDDFTGLYLELGPGVPLVLAGLDERMGTEDDVVRNAIFGDIDLVVRAGMSDFVGGIPDPSPLRSEGTLPWGRAEPFGDGVPIDFVVVASDGNPFTPYGDPTEPAYLEGLPVLVFAFADLDADGFIGVTLLDGDALDASVEEAELDPVGRRFAIFENGRASGQLNLEVGGPPGARPRVAFAAAMWVGDFDPTFLGGNVPTGPAVFTHLPFIALLDPFEILAGGDAGPPRPDGPDNLVGVEISDEFTPDPATAIGEAFTLRLDGTDKTIDVARMRSGRFSRVGVAKPVDPLTYSPTAARPLRTGFSPSGSVVGYEIVRSLFLPDDGAASEATLQIVPLDRLGNVTSLPFAQTVTLRTGGDVRIVSPDADGDPFTETVTVSDSTGVTVVLDDAGGVFDDPDADVLIVDGASGILSVDVYSPDPDVDDSGFVDAADIALLQAAANSDGPFLPALDLDGDGRNRGSDVDVALDHLGETISIP